MARELEELSLFDIIPSSIADDPNVQAIVKAIDPELQSVSQDIREALIYSRIDELPESVLDVLAWQWHVDFYELARTLEAKRDVVKSSLAWHRKKGTRWAILKALEMFGVKGKFTPWWEIEGAKPYTFAIDAELTDEFWLRSDWDKPTQTIRRAIVESKAKRSWLASLYTHVDREISQGIFVAGAPIQAHHHDIALLQGTEAQSTGDVYIGLGTFHTEVHGVPLHQATEAAAGLGLRVGALGVQGHCHDIALLQGTEARTSGDVFVALGTFHTEVHGIPFKPVTDGRGSLNIRPAALLTQGQHYYMGITLSAIGTGRVQPRTATFQGQRHGVDLALKGSAEMSVQPRTATTQGKRYGVDLALRGDADMRVRVGAATEQGRQHGLGLPLERPAGMDVRAGAIASQGQQHAVGVAQERQATGALAWKSGISCGIHMEISMAA